MNYGHVGCADCSGVLVPLFVTMKCDSLRVRPLVVHRYTGTQVHRPQTTGICGQELEGKLLWLRHYSLGQQRCHPVDVM